jgi:hypothetical protein
MSSTSKPRPASLSATTDPEKPAPTTKTSNFIDFFLSYL